MGVPPFLIHFCLGCSIINHPLLGSFILGNPLWKMDEHGSFIDDYPLVIQQFAIENDQLVRGFTH